MASGSLDSSSNSNRFDDNVAAAGAQAAPANVLDTLLAAGTSAEDSDHLSRFLAERSPAAALRLWLGDAVFELDPSGDRATSLLNRDIARLDELIARQVSAILHHPRFQRLEAAWRGLMLLTEQAEAAKTMGESLGGEESKVSIRLLSLSKREVRDDFDRAVEFDQSQLFKKVYEEEFGIAGGEPFGALIADYEFGNHPDDVDLIDKLSEVGAAAFCPLLTGAAPSLFGLESFSQLEQPLNLAGIFDQLEYLKWRSLRERDQTRFAGVFLPRVLMRLPYELDGARDDGFRFREDVEGFDRSKYLWGNAAYAFGTVLIRSFAASHWFADIRGVERGVEGGGLVTSLPTHSFSTDRTGVVPKTSIEVMLGEHQEQQLGALGFIPLCHAHDTAFAVYYSNHSLHKAKTYDEQTATVNARISAMMQYVLCASRFAHYLKVLARNRLGSAAGAQELENDLSNWLNNYVAADEKASPETKARFPLLQGAVKVDDILGKPGSFRLTMHLLPHFQLDALSASLRLVTKLTPAGV